MDKLVKKVWIDALRSGEYKQADGCLKTNSGFCCLGVLCDVYSKKIEKKEPTWIEGGIFADGYNPLTHFNSINGGLPIELAKKLDIYWEITLKNDEDEDVGLDVQSYLAECNDELRWDFNKIADWIEENL